MRSFYSKISGILLVRKPLFHPKKNKCTDFQNCLETLFLFFRYPGVYQGRTTARTQTYCTYYRFIVITVLLYIKKEIKTKTTKII